MSPYAFGLELNLVLACWLALAVFQRDRRTPGRVTFALVCVSAGAWCFGELASAREVLSGATAQRVKYAGMLSLPALWVGVAFRAARLEMPRRVPWFPGVLLAPLAVVYALLYSRAWGWIFLSVEPGGEPLRGPVWWAATAYNYALVAVGSGALLYSAARLRGPGRDRRLALGLAACVPMLANAAYVGSGVHWLHDPTPVLLGAGLLALRSALFCGDLLQLLPLPQQDLIQQLPLGLLLTDREGTVVSLNPAAEQVLEAPAERAIGRGLDAVLRDAPEPLLFESSPLRVLDREAGQIVLLDPPWAKRPCPSADPL